MFVINLNLRTRVSSILESYAQVTKRSGASHVRVLAATLHSFVAVHTDAVYVYSRYYLSSIGSLQCLEVHAIGRKLRTSLDD